jgi:hypothetical protein
LIAANPMGNDLARRGCRALEWAARRPPIFAARRGGW